MALQCVRGVALIVQNPKGEILILQEYETKPRVGKYYGMFSIPMETLESDESDYSAILRLVEEELPGIDLLIDDKLLLYVGSYQVIPGAWGNLYFIKAANAHLPDSDDSNNKEVGNHQWMAPEKALDLWLRQGAYEMISDFVGNRKGVLCKHCRTP